MLELNTTLTFFGASVLLALAPGPDNVFVLLHAAAHGRRAGMLVVLGLCSGLLFHTAAVALGLAAVFAASSTAFTLLKLCGAGYVDHGDGTITDTRFKLMWMKCAQGQEGPLCQGAVLTFTWEGAMSIPHALNQQGGFAGYTDWRVPTASELESLLQNGAEHTICEAAFPNAPEIIFWSSTTIEGANSSGAKDAWNVYFGTGSRGLNDQNNLFAVRLVRSV